MTHQQQPEAAVARPCRARSSSLKPLRFTVLRNQSLLAVAAAGALLFGSAGPAFAQWQTQSLLIKPGWSAVYLSVDASWTNLDFLIGSDAANPIVEVWLWKPIVATAQFVSSPSAPTTGGSAWANWERATTGPIGSLATLAPNSAYLVHSLAATNYQWNVKGKPAAPNYSWSTTSINLIGFPTVAANPPGMDAFLGLVPAFQKAALVYTYPGGALSVSNPVVVPALAEHNLPVLRGQAFWIEETNFVNSYFGPFQVAIDGGGTDFGASGSSTRLRLINTTASAVTVNLTLQPSEPPPVDQPAIRGTPPIIVRGALAATNMTYGVASLSAVNPQSWTLAPQGRAGSDIAVVLGVDRAALPTTPGALYAGILRLTDSDGFTEVTVPVSAQAGSYAGLWVGSASITNVVAYLKSYATTNQVVGGVTNQVKVQDTNGAYIVTSINTSPAPTASAYPLFLIMHNDGTNVNLLRRVFFGQDVNSNSILATVESALDPAQLGTARRITAVHFPWTPTNQDWHFVGQLLPGGSLTTKLTVNYDDQASNPFLHTYHPDHDNLDSTFRYQQPIGVESYQIDRQITLQVAPSANDFNSLTHFGQTFSGFYYETITLTGAGARTFNAAGWFSLNRLSPIATLTGPH
ncbi:MAG TPA: hypothetical protein VN829_18840 [Dongiaceae bacterium]|nr:hypothetical protein [Dongiaceae bacterium]